MGCHCRSHFVICVIIPYDLILTLLLSIVRSLQSAHVRRSHYRYRPDPYLTLPEPIVKSEAQG